MSINPAAENSKFDLFKIILKILFSFYKNTEKSNANSNRFWIIQRRLILKGMLMAICKHFDKKFSSFSPVAELPVPELSMVLALVFERLKNFLVTEQRLRGHKPKLVNALRSRCSVTMKIFCRSKTAASTNRRNVRRQSIGCMHTLIY